MFSCTLDGLLDVSAEVERKNTMKKADRNALFSLVIVILIGLGVALAGSQGGASVLGAPLFALSVGLAFRL